MPCHVWYIVIATFQAVWTQAGNEWVSARPSLSKPADQITLLDIYKAVEGEKPLLHLDTHTNPDCGVGINIQLSLQGFYNEIQKNTEEKMNTITLQDIINTYYQRTSMQNDLQNII